MKFQKHLLTVALVLCAACGSPEEERLTASSPPDAGSDYTPAEANRPGAQMYVEQRPFLDREDDYYRADPLVGHVHRPHARREVEWEEHPNGWFALQTNNLGFREDSDTDPNPRADVDRILVTGDSHIDGVLWNTESYPNVLERLLIEAGHSVEVLNGAAGYYSPYNYRRLLEKFSGLGLSEVVVTFYTGNDFLESGIVLETIGQSNKRPEGYWRVLNSLPQHLRQVAGQHLNQIYYLNTFPHMQKATLDFAASELVAMHSFASDLGVKMLVVLLHSKLDVEQSKADLQQAGDALNLDSEQLAVNLRMSASLKLRLEQAGITILDLLPIMQGHEGLYWERDHHLNIDGHRLIAETLAATHLIGSIAAD